MRITLEAIGTVHSSRTSPYDDAWDGEQVSIQLNEHFGPEALQGLESFSHVEVLFHMHGVDPTKRETAARHPRNNPAWPAVGIFAQRAKNRPNALGTTVCRVLRIEGTRLYLQGLDAVDGTPVLDLKPWVREFGPRGEHRQPAWMDALMEKCWTASGD